MLSPKITNKTRVLTLATYIQLWPSGPSQGNLGRKRNESTQLRKEDVKLSLADDMILYIGNPKEFTRKLVSIINGK